MLSLQQRINILFDSEQDQSELIHQNWYTLRNAISAVLRVNISESSALGIEGLEEENLKLSSLHKELGISQTVDLLQINKPICLRLTMTPTPSGYYSLKVSLWLTEPKDTFIIEHHVVDLTVESVEEKRLFKRVQRIMGELPQIAANILATA
jgi:hypothetical protein